jgi:hypothetical protein
VSGLPAGTYRLRYEARACGGTGGGEGAIEWYDDAESFDSAAPVVVKASDDTTGINVELGRKPEASPTPSESRTPDETPSPRPSKTDDPEETPNTTPSASDSPAAIGARAPGEDGGSPWVVGLFVLALLVPASAGGVYLARRKGGRTAT